MAKFININEALKSISGAFHSKFIGCARLSNCILSHFKWKFDYNNNTFWYGDDTNG